MKEPTRICDRSNSILDLIMVSDPERISQSGVLSIGLSDHWLVFCTRKVLRPKSHSHNTVRVRSTKGYNSENFVHSLNQLDWSDVMSSVSSAEAWSYFKSKFVLVLDRFAPVKEIRIKQRTNPWITTEILNLIRPGSCYGRRNNARFQLNPSDNIHSREIKSFS